MSDTKFSKIAVIHIPNVAKGGRIVKFYVTKGFTQHTHLMLPWHAAELHEKLGKLLKEIGYGKEQAEALVDGDGHQPGQEPPDHQD